MYGQTILNHGGYFIYHALGLFQSNTSDCTDINVPPHFRSFLNMHVNTYYLRSYHIHIIYHMDIIYHMNIHILNDDR